MRRAANRAAAGVLLLLGVLPLAGCQQAPSFNVLGSFFPAWLLCVTLGILLAAGTRFLLLAVHLEQALTPPILIYPCLAALFTFGLWLLFFH
jgi:YtcA-like protein